MPTLAGPSVVRLMGVSRGPLGGPQSRLPQRLADETGLHDAGLFRMKGVVVSGFAVTGAEGSQAESEEQHGGWLRHRT